MTSSWLGTLPENWRIVRLGALGHFTKGTGGTKAENRETGLPVVRYGELYSSFGLVITEACSFIDESDAINYASLPSGSFVFAASGESAEDIGKSALSLIPSPAYVGGDTVVFQLRSPEVHPMFLAYVLESWPLKANKAVRSTGFTVRHISAGRLKTLPIVVPPLPSQRAIAHFLAGETAQIDDLIAEQERLIGLLRERRAARRELLAARVAEGRRIKTWLHEVDRRAGWRADSLPLLSVSIDWGVRRRDQVTSDLAKAEYLGNYKVVRQGELVLNRMRAFQGSLGVAPEDGIVSPDYAVFAVPPGLVPQWLAAVMKTTAFLDEVRIRLRGIGSTDSGRVRTPRINAADFLDIRVEVAPPAIQERELAELQRDISKIDALIAEAEHNIALSKERRAALITEAVTGQINIEDYGS